MSVTQLEWEIQIDQTIDKLKLLKDPDFRFWAERWYSSIVKQKQEEGVGKRTTRDTPISELTSYRGLSTTLRNHGIVSVGDLFNQRGNVHKLKRIGRYRLIEIDNMLIKLKNEGLTN